MPLAVCDYGYGHNATDDTCHICPPDSYSDTLDNTPCKLCVADDNHTVNMNSGSTQASDCGIICIFINI